MCRRGPVHPGTMTLHPTMGLAIHEQRRATLEAAGHVVGFVLVLPFRALVRPPHRSVSRES